MNAATIFQIRVRGHLSADWADRFDGMTIINDPDGDTTLIGPVRDQAALNGLLSKVLGLNLELISVMPAQPPI